MRISLIWFNSRKSCTRNYIRVRVRNVARTVASRRVVYSCYANPHLTQHPLQITCCNYISLRARSYKIMLVARVESPLNTKYLSTLAINKTYIIYVQYTYMESYVNVGAAVMWRPPFAPCVSEFAQFNISYSCWYKFPLFVLCTH